MSQAGKNTYVWPYGKGAAITAAETHEEVLFKGTLHWKQAWQSVQSALSGQAAPQVRAAIARAARAGLPPAWQRDAEARLRQRDAAAVERLSGCANATPFRMASYQNALETAARFKLLDVCASCASILEGRRHDVAQALTTGMHSEPASALQAHLDAAGEFGLGAEAEDCRAALSARQAAAASALASAATQAEALTFSDALSCATDAGLDRHLIQRATMEFESRLHAAAAMYVQALHHLQVASGSAGSAVQALQVAAVDFPGSHNPHRGANEEHTEGNLITPDVVDTELDGVGSHEEATLDISLERLSSFGCSLLSYTALISLDARSNRLTHTAELAHLVTLEHLHLADNMLACVGSLSSLSRLTLLDLSFNRLEALGSVPPLASLRQLSLEGNMLRSLAGCPDLCSLTWLSLACNRLSSLQGLQLLPALEVMNLANNDCSSLEGVQQCPQLTRLDAVQNRLSQIPDTPLRHLHHLSLASNRVTFVPKLLCYPELVALELQTNQIDRVAEQQGLSALASLNLSFNLLHYASVLQSLRFLASLTELQLTGNAMEQHPGYVKERGLILPQLQRDKEQQRVPPPILEERLLTALAASTWAAAALQSWQCHGGRRPLQLPQADRDFSASCQGRLLRRRHQKLADMHRALLKDRAANSQNAFWRQHCAAARIAAVWRGRQCRHKLRALLAERKQAASAIQAAVRRWLQRSSAAEAGAAQRMHHGKDSIFAVSRSPKATASGSGRAAMATHVREQRAAPIDDHPGVHPHEAMDAEQEREAQVHGRHERHADLDMHGLQLLLRSHEEWGEQMAWERGILEVSQSDIY